MSEQSPISGRIVRLIDDHTAILNVGADQGVEGRMRFAIYTPTDQIIDPETNEVLGSYRRLKGVVVVDEIAAAFCVASAPVVQEEVVEEVGFIGLQTRTRRKTRTRSELNVDEGQIQAMPTGEVVRVGDYIEEVIRRK
jgi:hypothetical protein